MTTSSNQIIRYLALLGDPDQNRITREAWTVATNTEELVWAGWQPDSVVSVANEPPAEWYADHSPLKVAARRRAQLPDSASRATEAYDLLKAFGLVSADAVPPNLLNPETTADDNVPTAPITPPRGVEGDGLRHLASLDELHREEALGRAGWLFLAGTLRVGDDDVPCCFPLFTRRVRFVRVRGEFYPQWQGALQRNSLLRRRVDDTVQDPIDAFLAEGAGSNSVAEVGHEVARILQQFDVSLAAIADADVHPTSIGSATGAVLVPGTGFYLARPSMELSSAHNDLTRWTSRHLSDTALAQLYRATDSALHPVEDRTSPIRSALPLNERQRQAIDRLDTEPIVAVSGPPGTGKTHMIVAVASDAVAHGLSVLIATKSDFAAESTCELLDHYPTPPHVRFGREEHRRQVADLLSEGRSAGISDDQLASLTAANDRAWNKLDTLGDEVLAALKRKQGFEQARDNEHLLAAAGAPRMLEGRVRSSQVDRALAKVESTQGLRQRRAISRLRKLIGAKSSASVRAIKVAINGAHAELAMRTALDQAAGEELDELWAELDRAETDAKASQAIVDMASRSRPTPQAIASIAALATALRTSLGQQELRLPIEANTTFLHHLPFWVGTLDEIEATLPANPGMFDIVIFDEASQIDQLSAVPALCRARRAFVVGDPKQLRHSSAITRQQIEAGRTHAGLRPGDDAAILDIAANSLFDVAASATPVTWLNEHFRSTPHLIQFAAERWYNDDLRLMTQHPRNEDLDAIHTHRLTTRRTDKINPGEIDAIIDHLRILHADDEDRGSVGVITPFREQADALETAIADAFDYDTIRDLRLRVGTVRGVQGTERDIILLSLVIDDRDFGAPLSLVEDPHVFNVMTTRARSQMEIFHSFDPAALPAGILADWFRYESRPPGLSPQLAVPTAAWTSQLAAALELAGLRIVTGYPVAGWFVDLVVGEGDAAFGVETTVHPDGPVAHAERHLALRRAGWDLVSMFENSWLLKVEDAAVHLAGIAARRQSA